MSEQKPKFSTSRSGTILRWVSMVSAYVYLPESMQLGGHNEISHSKTQTAEMQDNIGINTEASRLGSCKELSTNRRHPN